MTVKTRAQINSDADTFLPDNTSAEISPADLRGRIKDLADSAAFSTELATVATSGAYSDLTGKPSLGSAAALTAGTAAGNVPVLDAGGKITAAVLPSYVDDVLEFANLAAFPATGESGKIFIAIDTNFQYRWGGSSYTQITASPGSTDSITEGSTNLYFTAARVRSTVLTGLSLATNAAIGATDTVLSAFGKLQKQISDLSSSVSTILGWSRRSMLTADLTLYVGYNLGAAAVSIASPGVVTKAAHGLVAGSQVSFAILPNTKTATISVASPAVVTMANSFVAGQPIVFATTGQLPTGIVAGTTYYVIAAGLSGSSFQIAATVGGAAINTTAPAFTVTIASPGVFTKTAHGYAVGDAVRFATTGALPTGIVAGTTYYVKTVPTADTFTVALTPEGAVIATTGTQSGTHTLVQFGTHYLSETGTLPTGITAGQNYFVIAAGLTSGAFQFSATLGGAAINTTGATAGTISLNTGADTNDGSAQTAASAFLTIGKAVTVAQSLDLNGFAVTIQVADGTYNEAVTVPAKLIGQVGRTGLRFRGNLVTPTNATWRTIAVSHPLSISDGAQLAIGGFSMTTSVAGAQCMYAERGAGILIDGNMNYGPAYAHFLINNFSSLFITANYTISGGGANHLYIANGGAVTAVGISAALLGVSNFSVAFAYGISLANIGTLGLTYPGSATGPRYKSELNSVLNSNLGGPTYFPGNAAGTTATGGLYA